MKLKYIGHACFKVTDKKNEYSVVLDPYANGYIPGLGPVNEEADLVLCSHGHGDHSAADQVSVVENDIESPFTITEIPCYHDDKQGTLRGSNIIRLLNNGKKLIHFGDIGEDIDAFISSCPIDLIKGADIALIPVGGKYTIDADQALDLIEITKPFIAVPMHFSSSKCGFGLDDIGTIEDFVEKATNRGMSVCMGGSEFEFENSVVSTGILVMRPAAL